MVTTKDTAEAVLASTTEFIPHIGASKMVNDAAKAFFDSYQADLKRMAELWLMKRDIERALSEVVDWSISADKTGLEAALLQCATVGRQVSALTEGE